jgi:hypothetical protein
VSVADRLAQAKLQLVAVHNDLLGMCCLDRLKRYHEVPCILDVDHDFWPALRFDLADSAEHLGAIGNKHLIAYLDRFAHNVVLD